MLANSYGHAGDCPQHVRASRLWKKSHTLGANSMSGRDSFATSLWDVARDSPQTCSREARDKR
jgi:hypothetical protein